MKPPRSMPTRRIPALRFRNSFAELPRQAYDWDETATGRRASKHDVSAGSKASQFTDLPAGSISKRRAGSPSRETPNGRIVPRQFDFFPAAKLAFLVHFGFARDLRVSGGLSPNQSRGNRRYSPANRNHRRR